MDKILFAKVKETAKIPTKRIEDGCYDLYACFDEESIIIPPKEIELISTGIASAFGYKHRIAFRERGTNTKSGLIVMAGQIDSGYRGEYFVALYNIGKVPVIISKKVDEFIETSEKLIVPYNKAICQFAIEYSPEVEIEEVCYEELLSYRSERMDGKLGSSGK